MAKKQKAAEAKAETEAEAEAKGPKKCFVIGPIGHEDTKTRDDADWFVETVKEVLQGDLGFTVQRADGIAKPGQVTDQVINAVVEADLIVADLTEHNPNAFYELGVAHAYEKPVIHMIEQDQPIPFDQINSRIIRYTFRNPKLRKETQEKLREYAEATQESDFKPANPVTQAIGVRHLEVSGDTEKQIVASMVNIIGDLNDRISELERQQKTVTASFASPPTVGHILGRHRAAARSGGLLGLARDRYEREVESDEQLAHEAERAAMMRRTAPTDDDSGEES